MFLVSSHDLAITSPGYKYGGPTKDMLLIASFTHWILFFLLLLLAEGKGTMKSHPALVSLLLTLLLFLAPLLSSAQDFDFFYFVLQWPGSYCDTARSCCYPTTGKPAADFGIHGLWPNYNDGSYPANCDPDSSFDASKIEDLIGRMQSEWPTLACPSGNGLQFWEHEWEKHGTCSESILDQNQYFQTALDLKKKLDILTILRDAGIKPDGSYYSINSVAGAIKAATGHKPGIECNVDSAGNSQLYQIYICVDNSASELIECPTLPRSKCSSQRIEFPAF